MTRSLSRALFAVALLGAPACHHLIQSERPGSAHRESRLEGTASFYGAAFQGHQTANGERFDAQALTAAHRTLPFGSVVRVKNLDNGREVTVRINDRGPYAKGRILDLSEAAARKLGLIDRGYAPVRLEVLSTP